MRLLATEPVMTAIAAVIAATIVLLVAFGVHITADQREAIEGWCLSVGALGLVVRSQVTPKAKQPAAPTPAPPAA